MQTWAGTGGLSLGFSALGILAEQEQEGIGRCVDTPKHPSVQEIGVPSTESSIMHQPTSNSPGLTLHLAGCVPAISFR